MDFSQLEPTKQAVEIQLVHPVRSDIALIDEASKEPVSVWIFGADSEEFQDKRRKMIDARQLEAQKKRNKIVSIEKVESDAVALLASIVTRWQHIECDGQALECTPANVKMMLSRFRWLYDQIDQAAGDRSNFIKSLPTS